MKHVYVYILASESRRLYIGCTSDLPRRLAEHRAPANRAHAGRYRITKLVHLEVTTDARAAVARERQIKGWLRSRKVALLEASNPDWRDLSADLGLVTPARTSRQRTRDPSLRSG